MTIRVICATTGLFFMLLLLILTSCNNEAVSLQDGQPIGSDLMKRLSNLIEQVPLDDVGSVSLLDSHSAVVWTVKDLKNDSWNDFREVLSRYLRKLGANQLGAVQPTHKLVVEISFFELHIDLFTVFDRQGEDNRILEKLDESLRR